jgi:predicted phage tail protein
LLRQWKELAGWLANERQDLKEADNIERAAAAWETSGRGNAWLLEGARLTGAEVLASKPGFRHRLKTARDFLIASRRRENERIVAAKRAELQAAREKQEAAEMQAMVLRKNARVLKAVLIAVILIAAVAVTGFVRATIAAGETSARTCGASGLRLPSETRGMQQILAPPALPERVVNRLPEYQGSLNSAPFHLDGWRLVSSRAERTVWFWDVGAVVPQESGD